MLVNTKLVFKNWEKKGKSLENNKEGLELSLGPFHSGTCFNCQLEVNLDEASELKSALDQGYEPVFILSK